jgi:hypothetical protein
MPQFNAKVINEDTRKNVIPDPGVKKAMDPDSGPATLPLKMLSIARKRGGGGTMF